MPTFAIRKRKAFTLLEILISLGLFSVIMAGGINVFTNLIHRRAVVRAMQKNLKDAEYALNTVAKILRTSSVAMAAVDNSRIRVFDYSQARCVEFVFSGADNTLRTRSSNVPTDRTSCESHAFTETLEPMIGGDVQGFFSYQPSDGVAGLVGYVNMALTLVSPGGAVAESEKIRIQTTVSLRDYREFQFNI